MSTDVVVGDETQVAAVATQKSNWPKARGEKKRKWTCAPLALPADQVAYEPSGDWPEDVREYLIAYARTGSRSGACRIGGISMRKAAEWSHEYGDALTEAENAAFMSIAERIEDTARTQALTDPDMPGTTMRIFLLKGAYPERYAEQRNLHHSGHIEHSWSSLMQSVPGDNARVIEGEAREVRESER